MKDLKDFLPLYLGQKCIAHPNHMEPIDSSSDIECKVIGFPVSGTEYECITEEGIKFFSFGYSIKLLLRPLSSMTEEEYKELEIVGGDDNSNDEWRFVKKESAQTIYLLSKGFDLFGLLESGHALDLTTVKV